VARGQYLRDSVLLFAVAALLLVAAFAGRDAAGELGWPSAMTVGRRGRVWTWRNVLLLLLASVLLGVAMAIWWQTRFASKLSDTALYLYLSSLAIFTLTFWLMGRAEPITKGRERHPFPLWVELALLVGITLVGLFLRTYKVMDIPYGVWYDEADSALETLHIMGGAPFHPAAFRYQGNPSFYYQLISLAFKLLGSNLAAVRITTLFLGTLAIPAFYPLAKLLFGQRTALLATFFLTISRWHFNFARFGMANISATIFEVLALYFLYRGLRTRRWADFGLAGLLLGGGLHTYTAFRLIPVVVTVILAYWLLFEELPRRGGACARVLGSRGAGENASLLPCSSAPLLPRTERVRGWLLRSVLLVSMAFVAFGPLGLFAVQDWKNFNRRLGEASVFAGKNTQDEKMAALRNSLQKHIVMFNYRGDNNGRHNLPGEPMLDFFTAGCFVAGFGYSLWRWRDGRYFGLVAWFLISMLAGIMSLDWEAPQGTRTIIAIPAVYLLAALPLSLTWESLSQAVERCDALGKCVAPGAVWRRRLGRGFLALVLIALLGRMGLDNYRTYFYRQAKDNAVWSSFSASATIVAREATALGQDYDYYLSEYYINEPTTRFLTPWLSPKAKMVVTGHIFPILSEGTRGAVVFLDPQKWAGYQVAKTYYPTGRFKEFRGPGGGGPALYEVVLSPEDIRRTQGLLGRYYANADWQGSPVLERQEATLNLNGPPDPTIVPPYSAEWTGVLFAPQYGRYRLGLTAEGRAQVFIDEELALENEARREATLTLAKGPHALRVRYATTGPGGITLFWQSPGAGQEAIPSRYLYAPPVTAHGLLGAYYANANWSGTPTFLQIDPTIAMYFQVTPLSRPYSVEWRGKLLVPAAGNYRFGLQAASSAELFLDDKSVVTTRQPGYQTEGDVALTAGPHDVRLRYLDQQAYSHVYLYWAPPGRGLEVIAPENLLPPHLSSSPSPGRGGEGGEVTPTPTPAPGPAPKPTPSTPAVPAPEAAPAIGQQKLQFGEAGVGKGQFKEPRAVAVDKAGNIFVADTGNKRVQKFDASGKFLAEWAGGGERFVEPVGLIVDSHDEVVVLDTSGWLQRFDNRGRFLAKFGIDRGFYAPRGLAVDADNRLYVADTGTFRIVVLSPQGELVRTIGWRDATDAELIEPTGIAPDGQGGLYVAEVGHRRVVHFDASGRAVGEWAMLYNTSSTGPHLATDAQGRVYVTDPERHRLLVYSAEGKVLGQLSGEFRLPVGVWVDAAGNVYVADTYNHRIQKFVLP
jgi:sugar lactone lactonase YvrE